MMSAANLAMYPLCSLCKGYLTEPTTSITACKHGVHTNCLNSAIKTHTAGAQVLCPECQTPISSKEDIKDHVKEVSLLSLGKVMKYSFYVAYPVIGGFIGAAIQAAIIGAATISLLSSGFFIGVLAAIPIAYLGSRVTEHIILNDHIKKPLFAQQMYDIKSYFKAPTSSEKAALANKGNPGEPVPLHESVFSWTQWLQLKLESLKFKNHS
jgi:hypothetical protein